MTTQPTKTTTELNTISDAIEDIRNGKVIIVKILNIITNKRIP